MVLQNLKRILLKYPSISDFVLKKSIQLTEEQQKIIEFNDGHQLILAGPGSGKTTTLIYKVKYLLNEKNIDPSQILMITFTVNAAQEMRKRMTKYTNKNINKMFIGTIDSFCKKIVHHHGTSKGFSRFTLLENVERYKFIKDNLEELIDTELLKEMRNHELIPKNRYYFAYLLAKFYDEITYNMIPLEKLLKYANDKKWLKEQYSTLYKERYDSFILSLFKKFIREVIKSYERYERLLEREYLLDYALLEKKAYEYVSKTKNIFQYKYIIIDEFQDLNVLQWKIFKQISRKSNAHIIAVGDENQAIYGFRGSYQKIFDMFLKETNAKKMRITKNFRSHEHIIVLLNKIYNINQRKVKKHKYDEAVVKIEDYKEKLIYQHLLEFIKELRKENIISNYSVFTILYRKRPYIKKLLELLKKEKIPYDLYTNKIKEIVEKEEILKIIEALKYVLEINKTKSLFYQKRLSSDSTEEILKEKLNIIKKRLENHKKIRFKQDLLYPVIKIIDELYDYGFFTTYDEDINYEIRYYLVSFIRFISIYFKEENYTKEKLKEIFESFIKEIEYVPHTLVLDINLEIKSNNKLTLITIHQSKGLEYPVVVLPLFNDKNESTTKKLIDIPEELYPLGKYEERKEEKNIIYVGMSRAKHFLIFLVKKGQKINNNLIPEMFIQTINHLNTKKHLKMFKEIVRQIKKEKKKEKKEFFLTESDLNTFISCPFKYYLKKHNQLPVVQTKRQIIGRIFHNAIARINYLYQIKKTISEEDIKGTVDKVLLRHKEKFRFLRKSLIKVLEKWARFLQENVKEIMDYENYIQYSENKMHISGRYDLIYLNKNRKLVLADFKTKKSKHIDKEEAGLQLFVYKKGLNKKEIKIDKCQIIPLLDEGTTIKPIEVECKQIKKTYKKYLKLLKLAHQKSKFPLRPSLEKCRECEFKKVCEMSIMKSIEYDS